MKDFFYFGHSGAYFFLVSGAEVGSLICWMCRTEKERYLRSRILQYTIVVLLLLLILWLWIFYWEEASFKPCVSLRESIVSKVLRGSSRLLRTWLGPVSGLFTRCIAWLGPVSGLLTRCIDVIISHRSDNITHFQFFLHFFGYRYLSLRNRYCDTSQNNCLCTRASWVHLWLI